jgi:hypothetical protein
MFGRRRHMKFFNLVLTLFSLITATANADEIGLRLNSIVPSDDTSLVQFPPGGNANNGYINGKMINGFYDWEPYRNFYLEGALGYRSPSDIFQYSTMAYELSPGFRVTAGYFVLRLSEGISWMPGDSFNPNTWEGYNSWNFVTHLSLGLRDPKTGIGIYLDRSHYSNGNADNNPSLDYAGFMLVFPIKF